jgi:hypothetical protein
MPQVSKDPRWTRHFLGRSERTRTTWKFRFLLATLAIGVVWATSGWWTTAVARSLVCEASGAPSDAILIENFDSDYLLFERAETLRRGGLAPRVLVPVKADPDTLQPNMVALGTANLMANIARLGAIDVVPWQEVEPISLNAARDIQRFVQREHIRSVLVLSPQRTLGAGVWRNARPGGHHRPMRARSGRTRTRPVDRQPPWRSKRSRAVAQTAVLQALYPAVPFVANTTSPRVRLQLRDYCRRG